MDPLVIKVTNNGFATVLEPLSRVAIEAVKQQVLRVITKHLNIKYWKTYVS